MKKITRYLIYILLISIVSLGLFFLFFSWFFPRERIKELLLQELNQRLQRSIYVETFDFHFFPRLQLIAKNIRVEDQEGFSSRPFLTASALKVRVKLLPLLEKRVVMEQFLLEHPQIKIEKNLQGHWNWESWAPQKTENREEREAENQPSESKGEQRGIASLIVGIFSMKVREGEITIIDETQKSPQILSLHQVRIDSSGRWRGQEGNLEFKARAGLGEGKVEGRGELKMVKGQKQPDLTLNADWKNINLSGLKNALNYFSWPPYLRTEGVLSGQGRALWQQGQWEYQMQTKLAGGEAYWERPEGKLKVKGDATFDLVRNKKEGQKFSALLSLPEAVWDYPWGGKKKEGKVQLTNLHGRLEYSRRQWEIKDAEFDFYGGKGKGGFFWKDEKAKGRMGLELEVSEVNLEELVASAFPSPGSVGGGLNLNLRAEGEGNNWQEFKRTAQGRGDVNINNFDLKIFEIKDPLSDLFMAIIGGSASEKNKSASSFKGKFFIGEGQVQGDDLTFSAPWYSAQARGAYDLLDSTLNLKGQAKSGAQKIDFQAKGPLSKIHWNFKMGKVDLKFDLGKPKKKKKKDQE